ncbi:MAG TPA: glucosaminidase domain-containing protein [Salinimicrobium sp.]|nr:glucosaminidase domain-containing protein [Salinimicrobium sp.]
MRARHQLLLLFILFFAVSCGTKRKVVTTKKDQPREVIVKKEEVKQPLEKVEENLPKKTYKDAISEYVDMYAEIAKKEMIEHGIPASITLAQGILESGAGKGSLSVRANNHFGIKCHNWTGPSVRHDDDELQECFRKYDNPSESYRDHSLFLTGRSRYADLFKLKKDDYEAWAKGLRAAGYATDRKYPDKLISLIQRYQLYQYDAEVLGEKVNFSKDEIAAIQVTQDQYMVEKGDTLYSISKKYGITVDELKRQNNLRSNDIAIGQLLFIENPKN